MCHPTPIDPSNLLAPIPTALPEMEEDSNAESAEAIPPAESAESAEDIAREIRKSATNSYAAKVASDLENRPNDGASVQDAITCLRDDDKFLLDIADRLEAAIRRGAIRRPVQALRMVRERDEPDVAEYLLPTVFEGASVWTRAASRPGGEWEADFFIDRPAGKRYLAYLRVNLGRSNSLKLVRRMAHEFRQWYNHRCPKIQRTARARREYLRDFNAGREAPHA